MPRRRGQAQELAQATKQPQLEAAPTQQSLLAPKGPTDRVIEITEERVAVARVERLVTTTSVARHATSWRGALQRTVVRTPATEDATARIKPQRLVAPRAVDSSRVALSPTLNAKVRPLTDPRSAPLPTLYIQNPITEPTPTAHARSGGPVDNLPGPRRSRDEESSGPGMLEGFRPSKPQRGTSMDVRPLRAPDTGHTEVASPVAAPPLPPTSATPAEPVEAPALLMPPTLDAALHASAREIVSKAPLGHKQRLLDELAGHQQMPRKSIDSPLGWLNGLVRKACTGGVIYTLADRVAADRLARQRHQEQIDAAMKGPVGRAESVAAAQATPSISVTEARERLAKARAEVMARQGGRMPGAAQGLEKDGCHVDR